MRRALRPALAAFALVACSCARPAAQRAHASAPAGAASPKAQPNQPIAVEATPGEWLEPASLDFVAADAQVTSVVFAVVGQTAFPLYCFDARHSVLVRGAACLRNAPRHARFDRNAATTSGPLLARDLVCGDGPVYLPAYPLAHTPASTVLLLSRHEADRPSFELVPGHSVSCPQWPCPAPPPFAYDVNGDGQSDLVEHDARGSVFVRFGGQRAPSEATPPGESGPFGLLAVADLDGDGEPELILQRDLGSLWEFRVVESHADPNGVLSFRRVSELGCGELG